LLLGACAYDEVIEAPPAAYGSGTDYAAPAVTSYGSPSGQAGYYAQPPVQVLSPVPGSYCDEAVAEARDAAAQANYTGTPRDIGRAERTAQYARRDCR
jgi:hypothetical protein